MHHLQGCRATFCRAAYCAAMADLFAEDPLPATASVEPAADAPLADRLRPRGLDEVVGQEHLTGPDGAIGRMVAAGKLSSLLLWGPPGTGKTSIARLLADAVGTVSYTHLRAHETPEHLVCRLLLEKKK